MNKLTLIGNLTKDVEIKYLDSGKALAKTALATSEKYTDKSTGEKKEIVMFIDLAFFGKVAEIANQYLHKGAKIAVHGKLVFEQWADSEGKKRSKHMMTVEDLEMLGGKSQNVEQTCQYYSDTGQPLPDIQVDEIPF